MKKINCALKCKKTKQLRCSNKCLKIGFIKDSKIVYSCDSNIKSEEESSFYNCDLIDNGITSECKTCPLPCIVKKFKSKSMQEAEKSLERMGFDVKSDDIFGRNMAEYAKNIYNDGLNGSSIDLDRFRLLYKLIKNK